MNLVTNNKWIGQRTIRPDGVDKVTGRAAFAADTNMPGMIWGKVLRSPHPHARIRGIDTSKAEKLPGVKAVVTARDIVDFPIEKGAVMLGIQDMRWMCRNVMAREKALFPGHPIAAVAATTEAIAAKACELIEVDYEVLPFAIEIDDAIKPRVRGGADRGAGEFPLDRARAFDNAAATFSKGDSGQAVDVADAAVRKQHGADIGDAAEHPVRPERRVELVEVHQAVEQRQYGRVRADAGADRLDRGIEVVMLRGQQHDIVGAADPVGGDGLDRHLEVAEPALDLEAVLGQRGGAR